MRRAEHSSAFSALGSPKAKLLLLGPVAPQHADLIAKARSFSIEHVSPALLVQQEISRRSVPGSLRPDQLALAVLRKWFWARKPDAGFLIEGFPATLLQARVFDEWLEARGENLTAVLAPGSAPADGVVAHYRTQGLLPEASPAAA